MGFWSALKSLYGRRKFRKGWVIFFFTATIMCGISIAIGCATPATWKLHMVEFRTSRIISGIEGNHGSLGTSDLPERWLWGFSGMCFEYTYDDVRCKYMYPPTSRLRDLIEILVEEQDIVDNWKAALSAPENVNASNHTKYNHMLKAAAAFLVVSLLISFTVLVLTIADHYHDKFRFWPRPGPDGKERYPWVLAVIAVVDFGFFIGAWLLFGYGVSHSELYGLDSRGGESRDYITDGVSFGLFIIGLLIKILSLPVVGPVLVIVCSLVGILIVLLMMAMGCLVVAGAAAGESYVRPSQIELQENDRIRQNYIRRGIDPDGG